MTDEQLARVGRVDLGKLRPSTRDDRHTVESYSFPRDGGALFLLPVRLAVASLHEIAGNGLGPGEVDGRVGSGEKPTRLHELGAHQFGWLFFRQRGAGKDAEAHLPSADVFLLRDIPDSQLAQQAGKKGAVDAVRVGRRAADHEPEGLCHPLKLAEDILPLSHPEVIEVLAAAEASKLVAAEFFLLLAQIVPEVQDGEEVAGRVDEAGV